MTNENEVIQTRPWDQFHPEKFTLEEFEEGTPFEKLFQKFGGSPAALAIVGNKLQKRAAAVGFKGYSSYYKLFEKNYRNSFNVIAFNETEFSNAEVVLQCGNWECSDEGIYRNTIRGREVACYHPILPVERLVDIEEADNVKYRLAFMCSQATRKWKSVIVDRQTISSARSVTALSRYDIAVTSSSAGALVDYLNEIIHLNHDVIPERKAVSRLGYIKNEGFSPYVDNLVFDGDANFHSLFNSVSTAGSEASWQTLVYEVRRMSITARILLAASFASPLLSVVGSLPFFVHLWGVDSGTGKTVALMLAASVWGNPELGAYTQTFNGTQVGQERTAAFLNHLPMCLDELQLTKDSRGKSSFDVYQLAQGVGRARGRKTGGIEKTPTWRSCFLTTGESPLTSVSSGAGAVNRVIDIECDPSHPVIIDGPRVSSVLKQNYGHAGRTFVEKLYKSEESLEVVREIYREYFKELCNSDSTEKQVASMAAILTADFLASKWVYADSELTLTVDEVKRFMASKDEVSAGKRAYDSLCDWVASNVNHFNTDGVAAVGTVYGAIRGNMAYIIHSVFNEALAEKGYSPDAVKSYLRSQNLIDVGPKGFAKNWRIDSHSNPRCIHLHLTTSQIVDQYDELPL